MPSRYSQEEKNIRLFHAVARGNLSLVKRLLQLGADCNACDYNDSTSLHIAVEKNLEEVVRFLIASGADLDKKDTFGYSPLDIAASKQYVDISCFLKQSGARRTQQINSQLDCPASFRRTSSALSQMCYFPSETTSISSENTLMEHEIFPEQTKEEVSIFFADVVNYTELRSINEPRILNIMLEKLFSMLDDLANDYAVQRIDAIDGCYIAATNFSSNQAGDHSLRLARFALEAVSAASSMPIDDERLELGTVRLQVGLHCGAVCGSMMGAHGGCKYTLVGDAVNVASRMESQGAAGAVQCSGAFAAEMEAQARAGCGSQLELELLRREGGLVVKGRGHMEAFWVAQKSALG